MFTGHETTCYAVGYAVTAFVVLSIIYQLIVQIRFYFLPMILPQPDLISKYGGKWAIITGGSDGIGRGYALELAKRGINICVISNYENNIASDIRAHNVKCKYIDVDFSKVDVYDKIGTEIADILDDVGILINNVGIAGNAFRKLVDENKEFLLKIMNINVNSMVFMTDMVLKQFVKKNRGLILNMASLSCHLPLPYGTMYSSSKSFILSYSVCLAAELNNTNVEVKCIEPSFVRTSILKPSSALIDFLGTYASITFPNPKEFSASVIRSLGYPTPIVFCGFWSHSLLRFLIPYSLIGHYRAACGMKWVAENIMGLK